MGVKFLKFMHIESQGSKNARFFYGRIWKNIAAGCFCPLYDMETQPSSFYAFANCMILKRVDFLSLKINY